jgi:hypothetical protein
MSANEWGNYQHWLCQQQQLERQEQFEAEARLDAWAIAKLALKAQEQTSDC